VKDFSPSNLVDLGPLSRLPETAQVVIKQALHGLYLDLPLNSDAGIQELAGRIKQEADAFSNTLFRFRGLWYREEQATPAEIRNTFQEVLDCASSLRHKLDLLPRGFVLP
jgi:hypothetical protein